MLAVDSDDSWAGSRITGKMQCQLTIITADDRVAFNDESDRCILQRSNLSTLIYRQFRR